MSKLKNWQKWLIITACIVLALIIMTLGFQLVFDFIAGPVPILVVVFIIYGIGRVWTRSPSTQTEPDVESTEDK